MEETIKPRSLVYNTVMMYLMTIAKLVIPLISLPYLTRVLSVDCYGSVSFVKTIISYMQIFIDFGFLLSATKEIIDLLKNKQDISKHLGATLYAQIILVSISFVVLTICCLTMDILDGFELFAYLYLVAVALNVFMFEYVFKAYEQMDKISVRFVVMKVLSFVLTLIFVKSDSDVLLIPIFEIISSFIAVVMVLLQMKKLKIKVNFSFKRIKDGLHQLKNSLVYFISDFATTALTLLNTLIIGIFLSKADVAYWSVALQLLNAIQGLYSPIMNSVYPKMIKEKNLKLIHKIMQIFMPIILCGCALILLFGDWGITLVFTNEYLMSSKVLKYMIPLLILSFPSMLYGWPCLAAINKQKANTISTIVSAGVQVLCLLLLGLINQFSIINIAIVRNISELSLCSIRMIICYKSKKQFQKEKEKE